MSEKKKKDSSVDRYEPTIFFNDPHKSYCARLRPLSQTPGLDMQYCSLELGHSGEHEFHVRWAYRSKPKPVNVDD